MHWLKYFQPIYFASQAQWYHRFWTKPLLRFDLGTYPRIWISPSHLTVSCTLSYPLLVGWLQDSLHSTSPWIAHCRSLWMCNWEPIQYTSRCSKVDGASILMCKSVSLSLLFCCLQIWWMISPLLCVRKQTKLHCSQPDINRPREWSVH